MSSNSSKLPNGWVRVSLGDLCLPSQYGYTAKASQSGNYKFLRTTDITKPDLDWNTVPYCSISEKEAEKYLLHNGDIVISRAGSIGFSKLIQNPEPSVFASYLIRFRPLVDPKYLSYYLLTPAYWEAIGEGSSGIAVQNVNAKTLSSIDVPLAPENEQTRIVEKLEELLSDLEAGVAELKAAQTKLTQYRQSLLKSSVEGSLTAEWSQHNPVSETGAQLLQRILKERRQRWETEKLAEFEAKGKKPPKNWRDKYPEPMQPDTSELPELPEGWVWASVDQCTLDTKDITDGPFGSNLKTSHYTDAGPRVIRLQNIGDGKFLDDKAHISTSHYKYLLKHAFKDGDTVIAMMGEELPRACEIPKGIEPGIVKADCARVRVTREILEPKLLPYFLNSQPVRIRTKSLVKGIGRPRINLSHIRAIAIPIPPKEEQSVILEILAAGEDTIESQSIDILKNIQQCEAQRKNILRDAFSGKLVKQDPGDEPASVLLEKIKAERAAKAEQAKPKRTQKKTAKVVIKMESLEQVLKNKTDWIDAQQAFKECGVADGTDTDRIEELYAELRRLDKVGRLEVRREGDYDMLRLKVG